MALPSIQHFFAVCDAVFGRVTTTAERTAVGNAMVDKLDDGQILKLIPDAPRIGPAPEAGVPDYRDLDRAALTDTQKAGLAVVVFQEFTRVAWQVWNRKKKLADAQASAAADPSPL